jgi:hypothetical protein
MFVARAYALAKHSRVGGLPPSFKNQENKTSKNACLCLEKNRRLGLDRPHHFVKRLFIKNA